MKAFFTLIGLCFYLQIKAGCSEPKCNTSNGFYFTDAQEVQGQKPATGFSTFDIVITGNFSCYYYFRTVTITHNDIVVYTKDTIAYYLKISLPELPGHYKIKSSFHRAGPFFPIDWQFELTPNLTTSLVKESKQDGGQINVYPNPATNYISIFSPDAEITNIRIYDSNGAETMTFKAEAGTVSLPLENLPAGVYFLKVSTLIGACKMKKVLVVK